MIIYFGKINLCSNQIYDVLEKKSNLSVILLDLEKCFVDGLVYEDQYFENIEGVDTLETTKYTMHIISKYDSIVEGYIFKDAVIHYKKYNECQKVFEWHQVKSDESVNFYFDVQSEMVGYTTANRFGFKEFLNVFQGIINQGLENADSEFRFTVDAYCEGINIKNIKNELKNLTNIQLLRFSYQPPNGMEIDMDELEDETDALIGRYKGANISKKTVLLESMGPLGINLDSEEVTDLLNETCINGTIDTVNTTKYGYAQVEATDANGRRFTTAEEKQVKKEIKNLIDFSDACRKVISKRKTQSDNNDSEPKMQRDNDEGKK